MTDTKQQNAYTVCLLFNQEKTRLLLQKKEKTIYAGLFNGVGGKLEKNETPEECARREIKEETGISKLSRLTWLGTLTLPNDCTYQNASPAECVLHFYTAIMEEPWTQLDDQERLKEFSVPEALRHILLAGSGDLEYFIKQAAHTLQIP